MRPRGLWPARLDEVGELAHLVNFHPFAPIAPLAPARQEPGDQLLAASDRDWVESVDADPLALLKSLGVRLTDVLAADRVLVLEGTSDADVLDVWLPEVLRNPRVAVLAGEGGDNARHADRLAKWLAGTDRAGLRRVLYLRDRDELSPTHSTTSASRPPSASWQDVSSRITFWTRQQSQVPCARSYRRTPKRRHRRP